MIERERMKRLSELTSQIDTMNNTNEILSEVLEKIAMADPETGSQVGSLIFAWDTMEDVMLYDMNPLVTPTGPPDQETGKPPLDIVGLQAIFKNPTGTDETLHVGSLSLSNSMMVRALNYVRKDIRKERKKLEQEVRNLTSK
jgi:hypothetical protein